MDDLAVNDGKDRADLLDLLVLHAEIILVENSQIRQFTGFDRADLIFHPQEPTISVREKPKRFLPGDLLVAVHSRAERIQTRRREVDLEPWIQRCDMDAVAVNANLNAMIDDRSERRTHDHFRIVRRDP